MIPPEFYKRFLQNAAAAQKNGYDLICSYCGEGLASDDWDDDNNHDYWCTSRTPEFETQRSQDETAFAERIDRIVSKKEEET